MSRPNEAGDYGRVIAPMNVEGMPWYTPPQETSAPSGAPAEELRGENRRAFRNGVMKATLLVTGAYAAVFLVFILFCIFVWFK